MLRHCLTTNLRQFKVNWVRRILIFIKKEKSWLNLNLHLFSKYSNVIQCETLVFYVHNRLFILLKSNLTSVYKIWEQSCNNFQFETTESNFVTMIYLNIYIKIKIQIGAENYLFTKHLIIRVSHVVIRFFEGGGGVFSVINC